jgi:HEAT repeat protein
MTLKVLFLTAVFQGATPVPAQESRPDATTAKVRTLLTTMASAPEKKDRSDAADELLRMGKSAVPALRAALKDDKTDIRYHAVAILGGLGADGAPALPELLRTAQAPKEDAGVRQRAIYSVGEIRANEKRCVPFLLKTFQGGDPDLHELAGEALGKFGAKAKSAVPALTGMVTNRQGKLEVVVAILGQIGPEAKAAVPALEGLLTDPRYRELQPLIERTLKQIRNDPR